MSYSFRERLKRAIAKDLKEKLSLTQDEIDWIRENLTKGICSISDEFAKALAKDDPKFKGMSLDEIIDKMTDAEFQEFARQIIEEAKKRLKYKKKEKKKKEKESETDSDSDAETDSDSDGSTEPIEEQEVECAK